MGPGFRPVHADHSSAPSACSHQALHAATTQAMAALRECVMQPRTAVGATATFKDRLHLFEQPLVLRTSLTGRTSTPRIEARPRDTVQVAHHLDRVGLPVCLDEGEDFIFRSEANRIVFFRRSCSI